MAGCGHGCTHEHDEHAHEVVLVIVGKIGAPYGVHGWQHIQSFTSPVENILNYPIWYVEHQGEWLGLSLVEGRPHGQGIVAKLSAIDSPESAALFTNGMIAVQREALQELPHDEFYWTDLEGLAVHNTQGENFGHIQYLYENADTDVMVVKDQDKERHIPFLMNDTVVKVDLAQKQVTVDWEAEL
ncbi:MAG: ribosome maturation factor RimM [Proteobacteria bacterium]|nr:ribosome maturation factor RimM [Pseudomonadota bacterium]